MRGTKSNEQDMVPNNYSQYADNAGQGLGEQVYSQDLIQGITSVNQQHPHAPHLKPRA